MGENFFTIRPDFMDVVKLLSAYFLQKFFSEKVGILTVLSLFPD